MQNSPRTSAALLALLLLAGTASAARPLVRFENVTPEGLRALREGGAHEVLEVDGGTVWAVEDLEVDGGTVWAVEDPDLPAPLLPGQDVERHLQLADIDSVFDAFRAQGDEGAYHSDAEVRAELEALAAAHPERAELRVIGESIEGRPLQAVRIGRRDGVERPAAVFVSMVHAREWITTELGMALVRRLLDPGGDDALREVLDQVTVYVVPVANPDGLIWSQTQFTWWRGNRRVHSNGRVGTDLNRNFPTGWGIGSSSWPGSSTYRGAEPLSEPEAAALDELVATVDPVVTMTFHAFGRMVLRPFGYTQDTPAREDLFSSYGEAMEAATGYQTGAVSDLIGLVGGATDDHFLEAHGAFAMSLELGDSFIPDEEDIPAIVEGAMPAALQWIHAVPALAGIDPREPPPAAVRAFGRLHAE